MTGGALRPGPAPCCDVYVLPQANLAVRTRMVLCERPVGHEGDHEVYERAGNAVSHHRWWDQGDDRG